MSDTETDTDDGGPWVGTTRKGNGTVRQTHTDRECPDLQRCYAVRPARADEVRRLGSCDRCDGRNWQAEAGAGDWSYQRALREAAGESDE